MAKLPRQLTSLYHLSHYIFLAYFFLVSYPLALRPKAKESERGQQFLFGEGLLFHFGVEIEVFVGILLFFLYELKTDVSSFDEGMHRFLLDCKILTLVLTFLAGNNYFLFGLVALYGSMAILLEPPHYDGESNVMVLKQSSFDKKVLSDYDKDKPYLIMFQNKWDARCHFFEPHFCEMSMKYCGVSFGSLDVANCPELSRGLLIEDEQGEPPQQLPVLILFYRGQEVRRVPQINDMGKVIKRTITKELAIEYFELDADPSKATYLKDFKKNK
jgi:thiol-disulfide isomerase/thioredoxin